MEDGAPKPAPLPPVRPILPFSDPWSELKTRSVGLETVLATLREVVSLNHIRDVNGQRNIACVREGHKGSGVSMDQAEWFQKYLANLGHLIEQHQKQQQAQEGPAGGASPSMGAAAMAGDAAALSEPPPFEWTSPCAGRAFKYYKLHGLRQEQAMATFLYAALLRQLGHQALDDLLGLSAGAAGAALEGDARAAELAEAAKRLRQAAGVWQHLAENVLPQLAAGLPADRPAELVAAMAQCLQLLALGEAQALTAFRAEERGSGAGVVAALHAGAGDLFEQAARVLRNSTGDFNAVSDRLKRHIAISSSLASERAFRAIGWELLTVTMDGAAAGRAMQQAADLLASCQQVGSSEAAWRDLLQLEAKALEAKRSKVESDRLYVYCVPMAKEPVKLPEGKVLVAALAYEPQQAAGTAAEVALGR